MEIRQILQISPVIPIVTIDDAQHAIPLAHALLAGGIGMVEITLRTPAALPAIQAISQSLSDLVVVGAGTVLEPRQMAQARSAGARFVVSPGLTPALAQAARSAGLPFLPGAVTPSEIMQARALGFDTLKYFPARASNGLEMLKTYEPVFPDILFCPTGGITAENRREYISLNNVLAVGGSWIAPRHLVQQEAWDVISRLAWEARSRDS